MLRNTKESWLLKSSILDGVHLLGLTKFLLNARLITILVPLSPFLTFSWSKDAIIATAGPIRWIALEKRNQMPKTDAMLEECSVRTVVVNYLCDFSI